MKISLLSDRPLFFRRMPVATILLALALALAALFLLADAAPAAASSGDEVPPAATAVFAAGVTRDGSMLTLDLSESFAAAAGIVRTAAYHLGLGETVAALDRAGRSVRKAVTEALATAAAVRKEVQKTLLEGFTAAAAIPAMAFGKGLPQGMGVSAGANRTADFVRSFSERPRPADALRKRLTRGLGEPLSFASTMPGRTIGKRMGESFKTTVVFDRHAAFNRGFAEPLKSVPSLTKRPHRMPADSFAIAAAMPGRIIGKNVTEAPALAETFARHAAFERSFSERPRFHDARSLFFLKPSGDTFGISDSSRKQVGKRVHELPELDGIPGKLVRKELSTDLFLMDGVFRDILFSRLLGEDLRLADSVSKGQFRNLFEAPALRDAAGKRLEKGMLETLAWADLVSRQIAYALALGEGTALGDADFVAKLIALLETPRLELEEAFDRRAQYRLAPGEAMAASDLALKLLERLFDEGLGQAEGFANAGFKELAELLHSRPERLERPAAFQRDFIDRLYATDLAARGFHQDLFEGWQAGDQPGKGLNRWAVEWQPQGLIIIVSFATLLMVALKVSRRLPGR